MSAFDDILAKFYASFVNMEIDVAEAARRDGFLVIKKNTDYTSERVIMKGAFCCHKSGAHKIVGGRSIKSRCAFKINFRRQPATGVYAFRPNPVLVHNHALDPDTTLRPALARRFTPRQLAEIRSMHSSGISVSRIASELRKSTNAVVKKRDIYNALGRTGRMHNDGVSQIIALLSALDGHPDFVYRIGADGEDKLKWLIFAARRSLAQFSSMSLVLIMDATYKTNLFQMPLFLISSVDAFGKSYVVACAFLRDETAVSYSVILSAFLELFGSTIPSIDAIVTDQDRALMLAVDVHFPNATHQLCRWHLNMNVKKNTNNNTLILSNFASFMHSETEYIAEQRFLSMVQDCSSEEAAYLEGLYGFRSKYVEAWVSNNRNMGVRTTQRAESMNSALKHLLETNAPLVETFHAIEQMAKTHSEEQAQLEFEMRDIPRTYRALISSLKGRVPGYILDLVEIECVKMQWLAIGSVDEGCTFFIDTYKLSEDGCTCPFFRQYWAPCAHFLFCAGENAFAMFHPGWVVGRVPVIEPAILYGPREAPRITIEDRRRTEVVALAANLQSRLLDMDVGMAGLFVKKFHEMIDRGSLQEPAGIHNPPITRPRGRPRKSGGNSFNGTLNF